MAQVTRVVIVGGGAAGMSCADTLAQHPDRFHVTVVERCPVVGGQATSISLDKDKHGAGWLNDGVQGGSPIFKHTFNYFRRYGHEPSKVRLQISFGKGRDGFWTNCFRSKLTDEYARDIKRFGTLLKAIKLMMPILGIIPISKMLRVALLSKGFGDKMVFPLMALFLGTGNQTANVASAILERLFDDPNMKLWDYDPDTLLPNLPTMYTFPKLHDFYADWKADLEAKGVEFRMSTDVTSVISRKDGVVLETRPYETQPHNEPGEHTGPVSRTDRFDDMVMCVLADDALKILGKSASTRERFVLGGARFYDDITITHTDTEYFQRHYETKFDPELCAEPKTQAQKDQIAFSQGQREGPDGEPAGFRPMYFTKTYAEDPRKIEMSFDCTAYQHQFRENRPSDDPIPFDQHIFQTIFLDKSNQDMWTIGEIDERKIIEKKWWHQLGHRWQHYVRVVPLMMFLNGKNHTYFAGSWTLVNMHELACVSGIAAAYRLGADYVKFDDFAEDFFSKYLLLSHGVRYAAEERARKKTT